MKANIRFSTRLCTATALCGTLVLTSQAVFAACAPDPSRSGYTVCDGTITGPVNAPAGTYLETGAAISGGTIGVTVEGTARLINLAGGRIEGTQNAVSGNGPNTITNHGEMTSGAAGEAVIDLTADAAATVTVSNSTTGTITHAVAGETAIKSNGGGLEVNNSGIITGGIDAAASSATAVRNGIVLAGWDGSTSATINGDVTFGAGNDRIENRGRINGNILFGEGENRLVNMAEGHINGDIVYGAGAESPGIGGGNRFENRAGGTVTGTVTFGDGQDFFSNAGTFNGELNMGGGADDVTLSGTINGIIRTGIDNDVVVVRDSLTLGAGSKIDAEAGDGDTLIFIDHIGTWDAEQFGGFEKFDKAGSGEVTLTSGWNFLDSIEVRGGSLIVASGEDHRIGATTTTIGNTGTYVVNGVHVGNVFVQEGGMLTGSGRISDVAIEDADVVSAGIVSPGHNGIGTLSLVSDYTQTATGRLDIELGAPGTSDLLEVGGTATLAGTVNFIPLDLADTGSYTFLTYGNRNGAFDTVTGTGLFFTFAVDYRDDHALVNVVRTSQESGEPDPGEQSPVTPGPNTGCTTGSGNTIICLPPVTDVHYFGDSNLTIAVNGMLELDTGSHLLTTSGNDTVITVSTGAGVVNTGFGGSVIMAGDNARLVNAGTIASLNMKMPFDFSVIDIGGPSGGRSTVENRATGVIGTETNPEVRVIAALANSGRVDVNNAGVIHGSIDLSGAEQAYVTNGLYNEQGALDGPATINGDIRLGSGYGELLNRGTINGSIFGGAGRDIITNTEHGTIAGWISTGAGNDLVVLDGALTGVADLGDGDDELDIGAVLNGGADMGDGNDLVTITYVAATAGTSPLTEGTVVDGGAGVDRLEFAGSDYTMDSVQAAGFEALDKSGGGTVTLTGHWDGYTGGATIRGGTLHLTEGASISARMNVLGGNYRLNGSQLADTVIGPEGMLSGTGQIGSQALLGDTIKTSLANSGVVSPGNSIGTLTVWGDYVQDSTGRLDIELGAPGSNDVLDVAGSATLDGAVQFIPIDAGVLGEYTFLRAAGGVNGTFATVNPDKQTAQEGLFFTYAVDYSQPNQVSVNVTRTAANPGNESEPGNQPEPGNSPEPGSEPGETPPPPPPPPPSIFDVLNNLTGNQKGVYDAFVSDGAFTSDLAGIRADLNFIGAEKAAAALNSFTGEIHASTSGIAARTGAQFARLVDQRMTSERLSTGWHKGEKQQAARNGTIFWLQAIGDFADLDGATGRSSARFDTTGFATGIDHAVSEKARVGLAGGYTSTDLDHKATGSSADIGSYHAGAYAMLDLGTAFLDLQASYARHNIDTRRQIVTGAASSRQARGKTHANELRGSATAGFRLETGGFEVQPNVSLGYVKVDQKAFTERGAGDAGLHVQPGDFEALTGVVGLDVATNIATGKALLRPYASLSFSHDLHQSGWSATNRMIGGGRSYRVHATSTGRSAGHAELGLAARWGATELRVQYGLEVREDLTSHAVTGGLSINF